MVNVYWGYAREFGQRMQYHVHFCLGKCMCAVCVCSRSHGLTNMIGKGLLGVEGTAVFPDYCETLLKGCQH